MFNVLIIEDVQETSAWMESIILQAFPDAYCVPCYSLAEARKYIEKQSPMLAIVDLNLPDGSSLSLIPTIRARSPETIIVVMSIFDDPEHVFPAIKAGAIGYLLKDQPEALLIAKLRGVLNGDPPLSPSIARKILANFNNDSSVTHKPEVSLSSRDEEILLLVAKGMNRIEIADVLSLSPHTVARYIKDVYRKLDVNSRAEAAVMACRIGIISV